MTPKISILVPIYNVEKYIEKCVHSLMQQTFLNLEFVFIDDASTDNSVHILETVLSDYPSRKDQVLLTRHEKNLGTAATRSEAIRISHGEYICWCDADDWVEPDFCAAFYEKAKNDNADLVVCDLVHEYGNIRNIDRCEEFETFQQLVDNRRPYWWGLPCRFMCRSLIMDHNLDFFTDIDMWEDVGFSVRLHFFSQHTVFLHKTLYHYNRTNLSSILNQDQISSSNIHPLYDAQRKRCVQLLSDFMDERGISSKIFRQKSLIGEVDSILVSGELHRFNASYRNLISYFMNRTALPLPYRLVVSCAMLGIVFPLRIYRYLSSVRRS